MKKNANLMQSKSYRWVGKVIFIIVISFLISYMINSRTSLETGYSSESYRTEYDEMFGQDKKHVDEPAEIQESIWAVFIFISGCLSVLMVLYELCGVTVGWSLRRIRDRLSTDMPASGMEAGYGSLDGIPSKIRQHLNRELEPMETVQWMVQPQPVYFTPKAKTAFIFAIPWTAFALFWTAGAAVGSSSDGEVGFMAYFGIPFIVIGLLLLSSPLWAYRRALKTVYVITDRRAITFDGGRRMTIRSYTPDKLRDVYRNENPDGTGDVILNKKEWLNSDDHHQVEELGFLRIQEPREVERILKKLAEQT